MKKTIGALAIAVCMLLMCGCVKLNINLTVHSDGNYDLDMVYAAANSGSSSSSPNVFSDEEIQELRNKGLTVVDYNEDGYVGVEIMGENVSSDQIGQIFGADGSVGSGLTVTQSGFTCIIDGELFDAETLYEIQQSGSLITAYGGSVKLTINLPSEVKASNATYISNEGKTLIWNILEMPDSNIHVEYDVVNPAIIIVGAVVLVAAIAAVVLIMKGRGKKQEVVSAPAGAPVSAPAGASVFCPQCGTQVDAGAAFCPQCGAPLRRQTCR